MMMQACSVPHAPMKRRIRCSIKFHLDLNEPIKSARAEAIRHAGY